MIKTRKTLWNIGFIFSHFFINKKKENKTEGVMKQNIFFSSLPFNLNKPPHKPGIFHSYFFYVKFYFPFSSCTN